MARRGARGDEIVRFILSLSFKYMREIAHAPIITRELKSIHYIYGFFLIVISNQVRASDKFCL